MTFPFAFFASAIVALIASILCAAILRRIPAVAALGAIIGAQPALLWLKKHRATFSCPT